MTLSNSQDLRVDAEEARRLLRRSGIELEDGIELDRSRYEAIVHHVQGETLVFTPVGGRERRLIVQLGAISDLPRILLLQKTAAGWVDFFDAKAYVL